MSSMYSPIAIYYIPPPTYETHSTDHMSSTYSPITILDPTIHLRNTQLWPHVQYVQSFRYIRSHHPFMEQTSLTTCPVRTVLSLYYIPPSTYGTHSTDHMSSTYSPITILDPTAHLRNTHHWPHVQYVQSYQYIRSHRPLTKHTSLTTCPVRTVLSIYYIPPPTYGTHITDHMSTTYSPITILYPTIHLRNTQHWPHVQYVQSFRYIRSHYGTHHWPYVHTLYYIPPRNTQHWPHVQYVQSYHYIVSHHPLTEHT